MIDPAGNEGTPRVARQGGDAWISARWMEEFSR